MIFSPILNFLGSTLFGNLVLLISIIVVLSVGYSQIQINDTVEIFAVPGTIKNNAGQDLPVIKVQNVGTRLIYMDQYIFNGRIYPTHGQVIPSTYSQAEALYWIQLPQNGETHVSLEIYYRDLDDRKWRSEIFADIKDGIWHIETLPRVSL